jgi:2-polyprenyl-6-methoxyphenol hydroxylase-like FAD-dependent oxidoreductase
MADAGWPCVFAIAFACTGPRGRIAEAAANAPLRTIHTLWGNSMTSKALSIAIVGAGIGGLATAAALRNRGFTVNVYEQAQRFLRIGAGIQMSPNAMKVLRGLGLDRTLQSIAFAPTTSLNREWDSGAVTNEFPLGESAEARYNAPFLTMHRGDLHAALASLVPAECLHLGRQLVGLDQSSTGVDLSFADGTRVRADAVIAADGVHSLVRDAVTKAESPRLTGRVAYRTTLPTSALRNVDIGMSRTKWWGPDRHIVIYFVTRARDEVYFVTSQPEDIGWVTKESWSAKGSLDILQEAYAGFHSDVRNVLAACKDVHKWAILERSPLPDWSAGRVVLIGDACHPMTPYMAQGAAMALEDAAVLSRCLENVETTGVEGSFALFEAVRKPRTSQVQAGSKANNWMHRNTNPDWVYGYDAWTTPLEAPETPESPTLP